MERGLPRRGRSEGLSADEQFLRKLALVLIPVVIIGFSVIVYFAWIQTPEKVGIININGEIRGFEYADLAERARKDPSIESVVLRINSPGGGVSGTFQSEASISKLSYEKPVVASLQEQATSGAYVIASAADEIYAYEQTNTAGLGVISVWVSYENHFKKEGIRYFVWKTGEQKDLGAPWRGPTKEENTYIWGLIENYETQLYWTITANRPETENYIDEVKDGLSITGLDALSLNLVDGIGTYEDAVRRAADMAGLKRGQYKTVDLSKYYS